jgi:hypothetical protein
MKRQRKVVCLCAVMVNWQSRSGRQIKGCHFLSSKMRILNGALLLTLCNFLCLVLSPVHQNIDQKIVIFHYRDLRQVQLPVAPISRSTSIDHTSPVRIRSVTYWAATLDKFYNIRTLLLWAEQMRNRGSIPCHGRETCLFYSMSRPVMGPTQLPIQRASRFLTRE